MSYHLCSASFNHLQALCTVDIWQFASYPPAMSSWFLLITPSPPILVAPLLPARNARLLGSARAVFVEPR